MPLYKEVVSSYGGFPFEDNCASIIRVVRKYERAWSDGSDDLLQEILIGLLEAIRAYDLENHSPHIQAGLEFRIRNRLRRQLEIRNRTTRTTLAIRDLVQHADRTFPAILDSSWFFPGSRAGSRGGPSPDEVAYGKEVLARLGPQCGITPSDLSLLTASTFHGLTATELAHRMGIDRRTVARRMLRARHRLATFFQESSDPACPFSAEPPCNSGDWRCHDGR